MNLFWDKIKKKRIFSFRKTEFDQEGSNIFNYTYSTVSSTYLVTKAQELAEKHNCRLISIYDNPGRINGYCIALVSTKKDYIGFCADFCKVMTTYIDDIEIY